MQSDRNNIDFNELCRLCLCQSSELLNIFHNDEQCSLSIRIMACSALEVNLFAKHQVLLIIKFPFFQVQESDALPKGICIECRKLLEQFYYFRKKSKNCDTKLRRHIRLINAGKESDSLFTTDDELEEDYIESRAFFERWDEEKRIRDDEERQEKDRMFQESLQQAIELERNQIYAEEKSRIYEEARKHFQAEAASKKQKESIPTEDPLGKNTETAKEGDHTESILIEKEKKGYSGVNKFEVPSGDEDEEMGELTIEEGGYGGDGGGDESIVTYYDEIPVASPSQIDDDELNVLTVCVEEANEEEHVDKHTEDQETVEWMLDEPTSEKKQQIDKETIIPDDNYDDEQSVSDQEERTSVKGDNTNISLCFRYLNVFPLENNCSFYFCRILSTS